MVTKEKLKNRRVVVTCRVMTIWIPLVLAYFCVPLGIPMLYATAAAISGMMVVGVLILLQLPLFFLVRRIGAIPEPDVNFEPDVDPDRKATRDRGGI